MKILLLPAALAALSLVRVTQSSAPELVATSIKTNARIECTHQDLPTFKSDHAGQSFGLPYDGGPNMQYGTGDKQTAAWSFTTATAEQRATDRTLVQKVVVKNRLGGQSGSFGKGGYGEAQPQFSEVLRLPEGRRWDISVTAFANASGVSNPDGSSPVAPVTVRLIHGTEAKVVTVQRDSEAVELVWDNAPGGDYRLEMDSARFVRGSFGGRIGQRDEGNAAASFLLKVSAH